MDPAKAETDIPSSAADDRRSSRWDIRNAPRNYFWLIVFQAGSAVFSFAAVWLITRYLGSEGYGAIVAVIAASQVAQIFVNWSGVSVVRYGVDDFVESGSIARTFWTRSLIAAVNMGAVASLSPFWFAPVADWLRLSGEQLGLVLLHFAATAVWVHFQMSLQAAKRIREQGFLQMLERFVIFGGLLFLVAAAALDVRSAIGFYIAAPSVMAVMALISLRHVIFRTFSFSAEHFRKLLIYSLPLLPFTLVGFFSGSYIDAVFVSKLLSTRDLGIYSIATQINGIAMQIPTLANTLLLPLLVTLQSESGDKRTFEYFRNILPGIVVIAGVGLAFLGTAGHLLIEPTFGSEFEGAVIPLWLLLTATVCFVPIAIGYSAIANSTSATYIPMTAGIASAVVNIASNLLLIPRYGMVGCALATLLAYSVSVAVFAAFLKRARQMPISWTFVAFVPSLAGAFVAVSTGNAWAALAVCLSLSILLSIYKRDSMRHLAAFIISFKGGNG